MTETKETTEKTLRGAAPRKPMSLKRTVESGHVRQNFSHGRSKSVVVEKKRSAPSPVPAAPRPKRRRHRRRSRSAAGRGDGAARRSLHRRARRASARAGGGQGARRDRGARARAPGGAAARSPEPESEKEEPAAPAAAELQVVEKPEAQAANGGLSRQGTPGREEGLRGAQARRADRQAQRACSEIEPEVEDDSRAKKKGAKPPKSPVKVGEEKRERIKLTINNAFDEAQRERLWPP
jgi:translation initiation factor IF-2